MFHIRDGLAVERLQDGSVRVLHQARPGGAHVVLAVIDADSWASAVAAVSVLGETGERWQQARAFHMGG